MNDQNPKVSPDSGYESVQEKSGKPLRFYVWLPIPILMLAIIVAKTAGLHESYKSETLTLFLSSIFYTLVSVGILFLVGRSFLALGSLGLLLLECGVILWGLAGTVGDAVSHGDANINVTIFNSGIFLAGLCHLSGAILSLRPKRALRNPPLWLGAGIILALGALWLIAQAALENWLPVFFIPGQGGTLVRYCVLISAIIAFALSAGLMFASQRTPRTPFISWYALALLLLAVGLFGVMIQSSLGTAVNWLARTAQWLGGLYLLFAAGAALRESHLPLLPQENEPPSERYRYSVAIAIVVAATAVRFALSPALGAHAIFLTFYPAVLLAALYGGLRAGLLTTVLSAFIVDYFWMEPALRFGIGAPTDWINLLFFLLSSTMISFAVEATHKFRACLILHQDHLEKLVENRTAELEREMVERKKAEEKSRHGEFLLARGEQIAQLGSWSWDTMADRVFLSDGTYRLLGLKPDEPIPRYNDFMSFIHPEDRDLVEKAVQDALTHGYYSPEFRIVRKDGEERYVHSEGMVAFNEAGNPVKMYGTMQDITTRKRMENRLSADLDALTRMHALSNQRLEAGKLEPLLQEIMDAAVAIAGAKKGTLQLIEGDSLRIVAQHGHDRSFLDFFDAAENVVSVCGEAMNRGERVVIEDVEMNPLFAGTPSLPVLQNAGVRAVQSTPLISREGKLLGILTTHWGIPYVPDAHDLWRIDLLARQAADMIQHARAGEKLRRYHEELEMRVEERTGDVLQALQTLNKERQRLYDVLETLPIMVCLLTPDYHVAFANRAFRESFGEAEGRPCYDYCFGRPEPCEFCQTFKVFETNEPHHWEINTPDGRIIDAHDYPFADIDGSSLILGMNIDVTEQRRAEENRIRLEEQLSQTHKMEAIGTLAGGVAHDFNNMLAVIMGNAELALDDIGQDGPVANLQQILKASKRSRDLVKQILTFSTKKGEDVQALHLAPLLKETRDLLRAAIPSTIKMELEIHTNDDIILANPSQIQQVILNLATNAVYAMRNGGGMLTIGLTSITLGPDSVLGGEDEGYDRYVKVMIRDTGEGIPPEVQQRIFEPFFTTKEKTQNVGMGLSVVYGIVNAHHGSIEVESEMGKGSTFTVIIPQSNRPTGAEQKKDDSPGSLKERILFVDDEPDLAEMTRLMLEKLGCQVTACTDSSEALDIFVRDPNRFSLVITDYTMPGLTGLALAEQILKIKKDVPIILCTGYSDAISPDIAEKVGIREYLMKPISRSQMVQAIRRM